MSKSKVEFVPTMLARELFGVRSGPFKGRNVAHVLRETIGKKECYLHVPLEVLAHNLTEGSQPVVVLLNPYEPDESKWMYGSAGNLMALNA
jgi:hypothetical protein